MTDDDKTLRRARIKAKLQKVGKTVDAVGFPVLGGIASIVSPRGAELVKQVGKVIGVVRGDTLEETDIDRIEEVIAQQDPQTLLALRQLEADVTKAYYDQIVEQDREVTQRHAADMTTDSIWMWMFRPGLTTIVALLYILLIFLSIFVLDSADKDLALQFTDQLKYVVITMVTFFFGSRGTEKITSIIKGHRASS